MQPVKLKLLLDQTKNPEEQQVEIYEDYVLSAKLVFSGVVKDVPEDVLNEYYINYWYVRDEASVLVILAIAHPVLLCNLKNGDNT